MLGKLTEGEIVFGAEFMYSRLDRYDECAVVPVFQNNAGMAVV